MFLCVEWVILLLRILLVFKVATIIIIHLTYDFVVLQPSSFVNLKHEIVFFKLSYLLVFIDLTIIVSTYLFQYYTEGELVVVYVP